MEIYNLKESDINNYLRNKKDLGNVEIKKVEPLSNPLKSSSEKSENSEENIVEAYSEDELRMLGKIMVTEFVGELSKREFEFLTKVCPDFEKNMTLDFWPASAQQIEFKKARDYLINKTFIESKEKNDTEAKEKNELIKKKLFENVLDDVKSYKYSPINHEKLNNKIREFKEDNSGCTKEIIERELMEIHDLAKEVVSKYLRIHQKAFFESLTLDERKYANVKNQEEFDSYISYYAFREGYGECYDEMGIKHPMLKNPVDTMTFSTDDWVGGRIYLDTRRYKEVKKEILNYLKETGVINSPDQENYYKVKIDSLEFEYFYKKGNLKIAEQISNSRSRN